jgi:hypothetical protein
MAGEIEGLKYVTLRAVLDRSRWCRQASLRNIAGMGSPRSKTGAQTVGGPRTGAVK